MICYYGREHGVYGVRFNNHYYEQEALQAKKALTIVEEQLLNQVHMGKNHTTTAISSKT